MKTYSERWVKSTITSTINGCYISHVVHYSFIEGHLLVDGTPLGRLPLEHQGAFRKPVPPSKHPVCLIDLYSLNTASGDLKNAPYLNEIPNVIPPNTTARVKPESKLKSTRLTVKSIALLSFLIVSEQLYGNYLAIPLGNCNPWWTANRVWVD